MRTKKLLILSLGVGAIKPELQNGKELEQPRNKSEGKVCPYRTANYRYMVGPSCIEVESPFVAEALIKIVEPDEIVIFGTVKSAWGAFYHRYHKKESEKYDGPLAVEVRSLKNFYSAEEYHQKYLDKNPTGYCHISPAMMNINKQK